MVNCAESRGIRAKLLEALDATRTASQMQRDTLWLVSANISTERRVLGTNWLVSHTGGRRHTSVLNYVYLNLGRNSDGISDAT